jgi:rRNA processing protein Krr1/Pno1
VQELHDWTIQMRGRINRGLEQRYDEQIRQANSFGEEESARFRIDDGDLQIDVSQAKEVVWDQEHLTQIADRMVGRGPRAGLHGSSLVSV